MQELSKFIRRIKEECAGTGVVDVAAEAGESSLLLLFALQRNRMQDHAVGVRMG